MSTSCASSCQRVGRASEAILDRYIPGSKIYEKFRDEIWRDFLGPCNCMSSVHNIAEAMDSHLLERTQVMYRRLLRNYLCLNRDILPSSLRNREILGK